MNKRLFYLVYTAFSLCSMKCCPVVFGQTELHGQSEAPLASNQDEAGPGSAPGADAMMTQDLLMVSPEKSGKAPRPLQEFVGSTLRLTIDRRDIVFKGLHGLEITVVNDTKRPLLIDGDNATATIGKITLPAIPVSVLQKKIIPQGGLGYDAKQTVTQVIPAAVTVGAVQTIEDYRTMKKPIHQRYGNDQQRRLAEASRFGKRILWPHQQTQGILYFQSEGSLINAKITLSANTLFDTADKAVLNN